MNKKYDKEYSTQFLKEVEFLSSKGIRYTFVKSNDGISTYKYEKTQELFEALAFFYGDLARLTKERLICEGKLIKLKTISERNSGDLLF
jgi:hypothetical protein